MQAVGFSNCYCCSLLLQKINIQWGECLREMIDANWLSWGGLIERWRLNKLASLKHNQDFFFLSGSGTFSRNSVPHELIAMYSQHYTVEVSEGFFIQQVLQNSSISKNIIQRPSFLFRCPHLPPKLLNQLKSASLTHWNRVFSLVKPSLDRHPIPHRATEDPAEPLAGTVEDLLLIPEDSIWKMVTCGDKELVFASITFLISVLEKKCWRLFFIN